MGQKPPGTIPELFAPGVVSGKGHTHGAIAVSPRLDTIYWDEWDERKHPENIHHEVSVSRLIGGQWTAPDGHRDMTLGVKS